MLHSYSDHIFKWPSFFCFKFTQKISLFIYLVCEIKNNNFWMFWFCNLVTEEQHIFTVFEFRISGSLRNRGRGRPASNKQQNVGLSPSETNRDLLKRLFPDLEEQRVAHLWVDDLVSVKITAVQKPSFVKSFFSWT